MGAGRPSPYATIANGKVDIEGGVIEIAARRFGVIKDVLVKEGDVVRKGQILARQEDQDTILAIDSARAAVEQAQSQLVLNEVNVRTAQREYDRLAKLASSNAVAVQQLDQARDAVATAQAQLGIQQSAIHSAQAQLAQAEYNEELTNIRAPVDGKIIRRYANPGAGASTLNVSNMFDLEPLCRTSFARRSLRARFRTCSSVRRRKSSLRSTRVKSGQDTSFELPPHSVPAS